MIEQTPSKWGQKKFFLLIRLISATIGTATMLALIRILSIEAFAAIAVIEGVVTILKRTLGFGLGEALAREIAAEKSISKKMNLLKYVLFLRLKLGLVAGVVLSVFSVISIWIYDDPNINILFLVNIPLLILIFPQQGGQSGVMGLGRFGHLLLLQMVAPLLNMMCVVSLSFFFGVYGYFFGRLASNAVLFVITLWFLRDVLTVASSQQTNKKTTSELSQLWDVSFFSYISGLSLKAWEGLPFIIGAAFLPAQAVGVSSIAFKFTNRINLGNQAFAKFLSPLMTIKWVSKKSGFVKDVTKEIYQIFLFNLMVGLIICFLWHFGGDKIIQAEKVASVGMVFYVFIGMQLILGLTHTLRQLIIVPSKNLQRFLTPMIVLRFSVIPILFAGIYLGLDQKWIIPVSLVSTSFVVLLLFVSRSMTVLRSR